MYVIKKSIVFQRKSDYQIFEEIHVLLRDTLREVDQFFLNPLRYFW